MMIRSIYALAFWIAAGFASAVMMFGCERGAQPNAPTAKGTAPAATGNVAQQRPTVGVVTVQSEAVPVSTELSGRIEAWRTAQVRARATGIVQQRLFEEGSEVQAGQILYRIDPKPLQASLASAQAVLGRAEATLANASATLSRYEPLIKQGAVSKQDYADLAAARKVAQAEVNAALAARDTAQLNLSYAEVTAPIGGRVGRSLVTEGALVSQNEATVLTTIQQLDPIYVNMTQSSAENLRLRQGLDSGSLHPAADASVQLTLEDGSTYRHSGQLLFTDVTLDQATSSAALRATFPNPQRLLLPGMYVRAHLALAVDAKAWRVPRQAVLRQGETATVLIAGADDKVQSKPVNTGGTIDNDWIVTSGLADGDRVIVDGMQQARPGAAVQTVPWQPPQAAARSG